MLPDAADSTTTRIAIFQALGSLSARQRECVVLVDYLGYDGTAAAEVLGMKPATVRVQLTRGRAKLRDVLGEGHE